MPTKDLSPRLLDIHEASRYLATSRDTVLRLVNSAALPIVRLPVERTKYGPDPRGTSRRLLFDVRDLDALIDGNKETRGEAAGTMPTITARRRRA